MGLIKNWLFGIHNEEEQRKANIEAFFERENRELERQLKKLEKLTQNYEEIFRYGGTFIFKVNDFEYKVYYYDKLIANIFLSYEGELDNTINEMILATALGNKMSK